MEAAVLTVAAEPKQRWFQIHPATFLLGFSMFATGACGLVAEYVLSTVSTYILGSSIEQFSMIIASMMLMMGIANYTQRFVSDENLIEKFIVVEISLALLCSFAPITLFAAFGVMEHHFNLVQYFFVLTIGYLIGFEIPLVLRINEKYVATLRTNIAGVVSPDYIGSFAGAVFWTYFLLKRFPLAEISFIMAGFNFIIAVITFSYFLKRGLVVHKVASLVMILVTGIALAFGYSQNRPWSMGLEQKLYDDPIVFSHTTKYQRLVMTHNTKLNESRFYINGNLQFSSLDEAVYHEQLVHPMMTLVPDHSRVLILGGGDGLALREVLKYKDVQEVTLVDLDPGMTSFCSSNPTMLAMNDSSLADARVKVLHSGAVVESGMTRAVYQETGELGADNKPIKEKIAEVSIVNIDADRFIEQVQGKYNVVIVDFPDPEAVELAKLYSREFYMKLRRVLAENGMFVVQSTSPYHAKESYLCIGRTIQAAGFEALPYHDNVPSFGDWGFWLCWKNQIAESKIQSRIAQIDSFAVSTRYLTPDVFRKAMVFGKGWLQSKHSEVNSLMRPILLEYYVGESWLIE